ncbi:MAG: hypothetical protein LBQ81_05860, partial [Zoogloeaceae bacterium]|nr:hypothetical protein [Zoogloeaceae bacterium]
MNARFLEPLDVLFLRGNKLFGDAGSYGEAQIPPWPSVVAGALRSRMLADAGIDLAAFAANRVEHSEFGTPEVPGVFTLTAFHLARKTEDLIEPLFAPPADLVVETDNNGFCKATALCPFTAPPGILSSYPLPRLPVLAQKERSKPASGYWLNLEGWRQYLAGQIPNQTQYWVKSADLWALEDRIGIGLNDAIGSAKEGALFTTQAIAFKAGVGFLATTNSQTMPEQGNLRLGGDGRAVAIRTASCTLPEPDYAAILKNRRCRLLLATPGIFPHGWLPTGASGEATPQGIPFALHGVRARLVAAAVSR